jgi:microcystin-dependent protein
LEDGMSRRVAMISVASIVLAVAWCAEARGGSFDYPYIGEVRIFGYNFCPLGWVTANGTTLPIAENEALFTLIGTTYGGDGVTTFQVPDLRGRLPMGIGQGPGLTARTLGEQAGTETETLLQSQLPAHAHAANATSLAATSVSPTGALPATKSRMPIHRFGDVPDTVRASDAIGPAGGSQQVPNVPPYLAFTICMASEGIYPSHP